MSSGTERTINRLVSIDILRCIAILLMVQVHFVENLSARKAPWEWLFDASMVLGNWPAPLFTFLAGLSLVLWLAKERALGKSEADLTKIIVRRGLFIFGVGIAFEFFIWSPRDVFDWDILPLIGASFVILAALRRMPPQALFMLAILVVLASPFLRTCSNYTAHWSDAEDTYFARLTLTESLLGFVLNGYFPLLPWVFFPLMGFALGTYFFGDPTGQRLRSWRVPVCAGLLLTLSALGVFLRDAMPAAIHDHYATKITLYPASTTFLLGALGLNMFSLWALNRWVDGKAKRGQECLANLHTSRGNGAVLSFCRRYSIFAFTVYVVHHAAHLWPLRLCEYLEGHRGSLWKHAVSTPMALVLAVVFAVLFYVVLVFMERRKMYSLEGWMRWVCE